LIAFDRVAVSKKGWQVVLSYEGLGYSGKFNPDPEEPESDQPVLTMTVRQQNAQKRYDTVPFGVFQTYILATDSHKFVEDCANFALDYILESPAKDKTLFQKVSYLHRYKGKPRIDIPYHRDD